MFVYGGTNKFFNKKNVGVKVLAESKLILIFYAKEKLTPNMWILFYNYGICMFIKFFEKKIIPGNKTWSPGINPTCSVNEYSKIIYISIIHSLSKFIRCPPTISPFSLSVFLSFTTVGYSHSLLLSSWEYSFTSSL